MGISDLNNDDYDRGWMAAHDANEDRIEQLEDRIAELETENKRLREAHKRMALKLREHYTDEYIISNLIRGEL